MNSTLGRSRSRSRVPVRAAALLLGAAVALGACAAPGPRGQLEPVGGPAPPPAAPALRSFPEHGIELVALRLSAGGNMIDLRYRVTDPVKAAPLLARTTKVHAVDEATGMRLVVPRGAKVGAMRQTAIDPVPGTIYFTFFGNTGRVVGRGSTLTVYFGPIEIRGLRVE